MGREQDADSTEPRGETLGVAEGEQEHQGGDDHEEQE
jgi:hypothetical protein